MNVIYIGLTNSFSFNEISYLEKNISFYPKYIIHDLSENELIKFKKNNIECQSISDALVLNNNKIISRSKHKIDKNLYKFINYHKDIINQMFKRFEYSPGAFSEKEKNKYIKNCIEYWYNVIIEKKINLIFHLESPHRIYDFIIYLIGKYLKIKNLWFRDPNLNGKYFIEYDYFESPSGLKHSYLKNIKTNLKNKNNIQSNLNKKYVNFIKNEKILFNLKYIKKRHKRRGNIVSNIGFLNFYINYLFDNQHPITKKKFKNLKIKGKEFHYTITGLKYILWNIRNIIKTSIIKSYYKFISQKKIKKKKFLCIFYELSTRGNIISRCLGYA